MVSMENVVFYQSYNNIKTIFEFLINLCKYTIYVYNWCTSSVLLSKLCIHIY